jgi:hypothetical protein
MPRLYDSADNRLLGEVSQKDIAVLKAQLDTHPARMHR